jgi:hypothetical protein
VCAFTLPLPDRVTLTLSLYAKWGSSGMFKNLAMFMTQRLGFEPKAELLCHCFVCVLVAALLLHVSLYLIYIEQSGPGTAKTKRDTMQLINGTGPKLIQTCPFRINCTGDVAIQVLHKTTKIMIHAIAWDRTQTVANWWQRSNSNCTHVHYYTIAVLTYLRECDTTLQKP